MNFNFYKLLENCSEIYLDESLELEYLTIDETKESHKMFNPFEIADNDFTVTFLKQGSGEMRTMTGNLFGPSGSQPPQNKEEYLSTLVDNPLVKVYTSAGWRSFIKSSLVNIKVGAEL